MSAKVFWEKSYQTDLQTKVASVKRDVITFTIFYSFSCRQESDVGTIGGYPVIEARKEGMEIFYVLPLDHTLSEGQRVRVSID